MKSQQLISALMMAVGAMLLAFGLYASDSIADRMSNFFTGHFTDAQAGISLVARRCLSWAR